MDLVASVNRQPQQVRERSTLPTGAAKTTVNVALEEAVRSARAIVFDWNGTVVDDADRALIATNRVLSQYRLPLLDDATFRATFKLPMMVFFQEIGIGASDCAQAFGLWNGFMTDYSTRLQPGAAELLRIACAQNLLVGVVSAASEQAVRADAMSLGVEPYLSIVIGSATDKAAVLREIARTVTGSMIYVGDTEYDMSAAQAAGVVAIGFGGGYRPNAALEGTNALVVIDDFAMISDALMRVKPM